VSKPKKDWKHFPCTTQKIFNDIYDKLGIIYGSLFMACILAHCHYKSKHIYIIGLDFYEKDYYLNQNYNYEQEKSESEKIKKNAVRFFKELDCQFYIYTLANFECDNENVFLK